MVVLFFAVEAGLNGIKTEGELVFVHHMKCTEVIFETDIVLDSSR